MTTVLIFAGVSAVAIFDASRRAPLSNSSVRPTTRRGSPRTVARDLVPRLRLHGWPLMHRTARRAWHSRRRMEIDALLPNQSGRRRASGCLRVYPAERAPDGTGRTSVLLAGLLRRSTDCSCKTEVWTFYCIKISDYDNENVCLCTVCSCAVLVATFYYIRYITFRSPHFGGYN